MEFYVTIKSAFGEVSRAIIGDHFFESTVKMLREYGFTLLSVTVVEGV